MKALFTTLFFVFPMLIFAQQNQQIKLWPGAVPGETEPKHAAQNYTSNTSGTNIQRISNITDPLLRMYKPGKNANGAAVIICAGGGNKYLAINVEGTEVAEWFAAKGFTAFVLEYRVPLKTEGSFQDVQRAMRLVRSKAWDWKLKTDKIGVIGFSAGGQLAARIATGFKTKSYAAVDKADSLSSKPDFALLIYPGSLSNSDKSLKPEFKPGEETPPIFFFIASDDQYGIPFSMAAALRDLKKPFEFHVCPKGGHGYGLRKGNPAAETWPALAEKWLKNVL